MNIKWRERTEKYYGNEVPAYDLYWANGKILTIAPMHDDNGVVEGRWYVSAGNFAGYFDPTPYYNDKSLEEVKEKVLKQLKDHIDRVLGFYNDMNTDIELWVERMAHND